MQVLQVKASQSTVKMGIDYDNQYQVDIPLTVCCFAHTAVSIHDQGCVPCCDAHVLHVHICVALLHVAIDIQRHGDICVCCDRAICISAPRNSFVLARCWQPALMLSKADCQYTPLPPPPASLHPSWATCILLSCMCQWALLLPEYCKYCRVSTQQLCRQQAERLCASGLHGIL